MVLQLRIGHLIAIWRSYILLIVTFLFSSWLHAAPFLADQVVGLVRPEDLLYKSFKLISLNDWTDLVHMFEGSELPYLQIQGDFKIVGKVCNQFSGKGTLKSGTLKVEGLISTKKMCWNPRLMEIESRLMKVLHEGCTVQLEAGELSLITSDTRLRFARTE